MSGGFAALVTLSLGLNAQTPEAIVDCAPIGETAQAEAWTSYRAGRDLLYAHRWSEAIDALLGATRIEPRLALAHYGLGEAYMALKRHPEALDAFLACREAYRCARTPEDRAQAARRRDEEIQALRDAIRRMERDRLVSGAIPWQEVNKGSRISMGESLRVIQEFEKRLAELVESRQHDDTAEPPELAFALGNARFQTGALTEAEREFRTALAVRPRWGDAHHNLALVLVLTGRVDESEREVKLAEKSGTQIDPRLTDEIRKRKTPDKK